MAEVFHERLKSPIPTAELERRTAELQAAMKANGIDCIIAQNITQYMGGCNRWLTDTTAENNYPQSSILPSDGYVRYIACSGPPLDLYPPSHLLRIGKPWAAQPYFSPFNFTNTWEGRLAARWIKENNAKKVGVAGMEMFFYNYYEYISENVPGVEIVDISDMFDEIRAVKSSDEIAFARKTADIQDKAMSYVAAYAQPGVREYELRSKLMQVLTDHGGEEMVIYMGSCPSGEYLKPLPSFFQNRVLEKGDMLYVKLSTAGPGGIFATLGRVFSIGCNADSEMLSDTAAAIEAENVLISMLKPGADPEVIFAEYNNYLKKFGYDTVDGLFAYSQGYDHVERPSIQTGETMKLIENMNIAVNISLTGAGRKSAYCADTYIIGKDGAEKLHATKHAIVRC